MSSQIRKFSSSRLIEAGRRAKRLVTPDGSVRKEVAIQVACTLLVTRGHGFHSSAVEVNKLMGTHDGFHCDFALWRATGGLPNLILRLENGKVIPKGVLAEWSPDFWHGLKSSGAISRVKRATWVTTPQLVDRPALKEAFLPASPDANPLGFSCKAQMWGGKVKMDNLWIAEMGGDDPYGEGAVESLMGVLAGGRRVWVKKQSWLAIPKRDEVVRILQGVNVPYLDWKRVGPRTILVSPFWGALLAPLMPSSFRQWFEGWGMRPSHVGMCPLLPWAFMRGAWGKVSEVKVPEGAIPWMVNRHTLAFSRISVLKVKEESLKRYGFLGVDSRVRKAWLRSMWLRGVRAGDFPVGRIPLDFPDS